MLPAARTFVANPTTRLPDSRLHMPPMIVLYLALVELLWLRALPTYVCSMGLESMQLLMVPCSRCSRQTPTCYRFYGHHFDGAHIPLISTDPAPGAWGVSIQVSTREPYPFLRRLADQLLQQRTVQPHATLSPFRPF